MQPETQYVRSPEGAVAYQVVGDGPFDLVFNPNWGSNVDIMWDIPQCARYLRRLASFSRLILFDKRGSGVSDPVPTATLPTLEQWMDDIRVVMDAAGSSRAALVGDAEGGLMAMLFAATQPDRTSALVVINSTARLTRAEDYPIGYPPHVLEKVLANLSDGWGSGAHLELSAPSVAADAEFKRMWARYQRLSLPPGIMIASYRSVMQHNDLRAILPAIRVPTLVVHRAGNIHIRPAHGRYLAEHVPGARFVEVPGADFSPFFAGDTDVILDEVEEFLTGSRAAPEADRVLATVLFTDLVDSTRRTAELGDRRWGQLLEAHNDIVRQLFGKFRGREVGTTGDGFVATSDGPARAVLCARAIATQLRALGLESRAGLHTGEVEMRGGVVGGLALNLAARVMAEAGPGECLVTSTVKDLVLGSGIAFADRGLRALKGVPGEWRLYAVKS